MKSQNMQRNEAGAVVKKNYKRPELKAHGKLKDTAASTTTTTSTYTYTTVL